MIPLFVVLRRATRAIAAMTAATGHARTGSRTTSGAEAMPTAPRARPATVPGSELKDAPTAMTTGRTTSHGVTAAASTQAPAVRSQVRTKAGAAEREWFKPFESLARGCMR